MCQGERYEFDCFLIYLCATDNELKWTKTAVIAVELIIHPWSILNA